MKLVVVNAGIGNTGSIPNMLRRLGVHCEVSDDPHCVAEADALILPGVGHFDSVICGLKEKGLWNVLDEQAACGIPVLGICLGMQLLANGSEEGTLEGFGWIPGHVVRFLRNPNRKIPHMGWSHVHAQTCCPLLQEFTEDPRFYFVHSYHFIPNKEAAVVGTTEYGTSFCSVVQSGNIFGVQFHPEKSHRFGLQLFQNYIRFAEEQTLCRSLG